MTVSTIGSTGDYSTINSWEADAPAGTLSAPWEGQLQDQAHDGGDGSGAVITIAGNTVDATNHKILSVVAGDSFVDNMDPSSDALKYDTSKGAYIFFDNDYRRIHVQETYTELERFQVTSSDNAPSFQPIYFNHTVNSAGTHAIARQLIVQRTGHGPCIEVANSTWKAINCLLISTSTGAGGDGIQTTYSLQADSGAYNCTIVSPSDVTSAANGFLSSGGGVSPRVQNCAVFGFNAQFSGSFDSGSGYICTSAASPPGSNNQASQTFADQFKAVTNASQDWRAADA